MQLLMQRHVLLSLSIDRSIDGSTLISILISRVRHILQLQMTRDRSLNKIVASPVSSSKHRTSDKRTFVYKNSDVHTMRGWHHKVNLVEYTYLSMHSHKTRSGKWAIADHLAFGRLHVCIIHSFNRQSTDASLH